MSKNQEMPYEITNCKEKNLGYSSIKSQLNFLLGKVLTIIDASIEDKQKNKAIKDLIKSSFSSQQDWIYQLCGLPKMEDSDSEENEIINQSVTIK